jgi:hypothetical protein
MDRQPDDDGRDRRTRGNLLGIRIPKLNSKLKKVLTAAAVAVLTALLSLLSTNHPVVDNSLAIGAPGEKTTSSSTRSEERKFSDAERVDRDVLGNDQRP